MINSEIKEFLKEYKTKTEKENFTYNNINTVIDEIKNIYEELKNDSTKELSDENKKLIEKYNEINLTNIKMNNQENLLESINKNLINLNALQNDYIDTVEKVNKSKNLDKNNKNDVINMLNNSNVKDLDKITNAVNTMLIENESNIKLLSTIKNDLDANEKINIVTRKKLEKEFFVVLDEIKNGDINAYKDVDKLIEKFEKEKIEISNKDSIKEILDKQFLSIINNVLRKDMENIIEKDIKTFESQFGSIKEKIPNFNNLIEELKSDTISYNDFISKLEETNDESIKELTNTFNNNIDKLFETQNTFVTAFDKEIKELTSEQKSQISELYKSFEKGDITQETLIKSINDLTNIDKEQKDTTYKLIEFIKENSTDSKMDNASKIKEEQRYKQNQELVENMEKTLNNLNIKENESVISKLQQSSDFEDLGQKSGEMLLDHLFGEGTLVEKVGEKLKSGYDKTKSAINEKLFRRNEKQTTNKLDQVKTSIDKQTKELIKNENKNYNKLDKDIKTNTKVTKTESDQTQRELSSLDTGDSGLNFGDNKRSRNKRGKNKRPSKLSKFLPKGLGSKIGNVASKVGGIASKIPGVDAVGEMLGGASILGEGGMLAGAGSTLASVGSMAMTALPVVAGAAALGAAAYGLYHLSIDDDSEEIMDQLESQGAVNHNFFGDSEITDWSKVLILDKKQLDALDRYDDWSESDKKTIEQLEKTDDDVKHYLADMVSKGMAEKTDDGFKLNAGGLEMLKRTNILQDETKLKSLERLLDSSSKKEVDKLEKPKPKEKKKEIKDTKPNKDDKSKDDKLKGESKEEKPKGFLDKAEDMTKSILENATPLGLVKDGVDSLLGEGSTDKAISGAMDLIKKGIKLTPIGAALSLFSNDKSKEIFNSLKDKGIVEHNFFGNSEVKDWNGLLQVSSKDLQILSKYDDFSKETQSKIENLSKVDDKSKSILAELIKDKSATNNNGIINISEKGIEKLKESKIELKSLEPVLDKNTIKKIDNDTSKKETPNPVSDELKTNENISVKETPSPSETPNPVDDNSKKDENTIVKEETSKTEKTSNDNSKKDESTSEIKQIENQISKYKEQLEMVKLNPNKKLVDVQTKFIQNKIKTLQTKLEDKKSSIKNNVDETPNPVNDELKTNVNENTSVKEETSNSNETLSPVENNSNTDTDESTPEIKQIENQISRYKEQLEMVKLNPNKKLVDVQTKFIQNKIKTLQTKLEDKKSSIKNINELKLKDINKDLQPKESGFLNSTMKKIFGDTSTNIDDNDMKPVDDLIQKGETNPVMIAHLTGKNLKDVKNHMSKKTTSDDSPKINTKELVKDKKESSPTIINNSQSNDGGVVKKLTPDRISDKSLSIITAF